MQAELPVVGDANSTELYEALTVQAWVNVGAANCSDAGDKSAGVVLVAANSGLDTQGLPHSPCLQATAKMPVPP
ncbi:hypothetical protein ACW0JT_06790 [Arthrobacter sp. SA17]